MCFDGETGCFVNLENAFTITCFMAQKAGCMDHGAMVKRRPSRLRPLMLRFLSAPVYAHKRVRRRRSLRVRTSAAMAKARPSRLRPLMLRFLSAPVYAHKRVRQPRNLHIRTLSAMAKARPSHSRPLMLRFLTGLAHALFWTKCLRFL